MVNQGVVAKGEARREEIVQVALEVFARSGYRGTSLREVAELTGLTQAGLLHHFGSRENLLVEILRRREELGRESNPASGTAAGLATALRQNVRTPGLVELHSVLVTQAGDPAHPAHEHFTSRYERMRGRIAADLARRVAEGSIDSRVDPQKLATILVALADGLQVQWMLDDSIDMAEHYEHLLSLLSKS
jgi:AcrR family transcriptional regulator